MQSSFLPSSLVWSNWREPVGVANLRIETYGLPVRIGVTRFGETETLNLLRKCFENDV